MLTSSSEKIFRNEKISDYQQNIMNLWGSISDETFKRYPEFTPSENHAREENALLS